MISVLQQVAELITPSDEWVPVTIAGMFVPTRMRKMGPDGEWVYRPPTEAEIRAYVKDEAF